MKSGCSASTGTHSHSVVMSGAAISSWYQRSRPSVIGTSPSTRLMTMTFSTVVSPWMATSALVLDGRGLGAAMALVRADEDLGAAVVDAGLEGLGAEAAEHHHVDGADARAGEHDDRQLGDHRQVEGDAVTLLDAVLLEDVGELADLVLELGVRVRVRVAGVALEDDGGLVALAGLDVTVDAVVGRVELAALEPLDVGLGVEAPVEDRVPLLRPDERILGALGPVPLGVLDGPLVVGLVLAPST